MAGSRPFGVTLVGIIILIWGALALVFGILALFNRGTSGTAGLWAAIITIAVGVIYLAVAKGLFNGSRISRLVVAFATVLSLAAGVWTLIAISGSRVAGGVQALVALIVLGMLYSRRASEFFR